MSDEQPRGGTTANAPKTVSPKEWLRRMDAEPAGSHPCSHPDPALCDCKGVCDCHFEEERESMTNIIDPVYLINGNSVSRMSREKMAELSERMKEIAKDFDVPVCTTITRIKDMEKMKPEDIPLLVHTPTTGKTTMTLTWLKERAQRGDTVLFLAPELDWDRFSTPEDS